MFLPVMGRAESLAEIDAALKRIASSVLKTIKGARVQKNFTEGKVTKLFVNADRAQVKIELSPVMRGTAYDPELRSVSERVEEEFGFAEIQVVSFADLYAGKLVAALDRQHPRDLFDARNLLANEGLTDNLREAFILYLIGHNRPMHEVLEGNRKDITQEYQDNFVGMTEAPVELAELTKAQDEMIAALIGGMPQRHKDFLIGFERGEPDWSLLHIQHASELPAVLWRQKNLDTLTKEQRAALVSALEAALGKEP
jgi:hypothetical protein